MNIKKLIVAGLTSCLFSLSVAYADQVKIGIAAEPYPPFASLNASGKWIGWEVEIIDAVCEAAKLDCVITPVAWDGIIPSLTGQQIDAIMASMSITAERMKTIDFSYAYYNTPAVIVAEKSMNIGVTPNALAGKIIGVQASTIHQAYAQKYFGSSSELRVYQTQDEANQDLAAGRIDAIQADSIAMADFVGSSSGGCCEIKGAVANDETILGKGVGAGVRKGDNALRYNLNAGIAAILANGKHQEITARYFKSSIFND